MFSQLTLLSALLCSGNRALAATAPKPLVATAWYAGWHSADFPLSSVAWSKYTQMTYAFAETTPDVNTLSLDGSNAPLLPQFVATAKKNGVKAAVSVGGWTGSRYYSTNVGSAANRTAFVKTIVNFATTYQLDGIDFDWEYPNNQGIGCNTINDNDTPNFLLFLQELRKDPIGKTLILSAATAISPFMDVTGSPSASVSGFAKVLDFIAIMNYDIWGPWSASVGPNAPLKDACASGANQQGSAVAAVAAWTGAGMPVSQIVLGVAAYGHSFTVTPANAFVKGSKTALAAYPAFDAADPPAGDAWDDAAGVDECGNEQGPGGNFDFWGLIDAGFLNADGSVAQGIAYRFDTCSMTPYVYNATRQLMVSFDNAQSFAAKGAYIKSTGLRGFAAWEAGGDSSYILTNAIRTSAGF